MRTITIILAAAVLLALSSVSHAAMAVTSQAHHASAFPSEDGQQADAETLAKKKKKKKKKKKSSAS